MTVVEVAARHASNTVAGVLGAERFEDPENARTILLMSGGLVLLAVLILVGTVWWWRTSKVEHPSLAPLEVMSSRRWWKGDYTARRRRLDAARPATEPGDAAAVVLEAVDLDAVRRGSPPQFDDLADVAPMVHVDAANGGDMADLDALLAAAGASIADMHVVVAPSAAGSAVVEPAVVEPAVVEPAVVEPAVVEPAVVEPAAVEPAAVEPAAVEPAVVLPAATDDPTVALEGARGPIDPLLRSSRTD